MKHLLFFLCAVFYFSWVEVKKNPNNQLMAQSILHLLSVRTGNRSEILSQPQVSWLSGNKSSVNVDRWWWWLFPAAHNAPFDIKNMVRCMFLGGHRKANMLWNEKDSQKHKQTDIINITQAEGEKKKLLGDRRNVHSAFSCSTFISTYSLILSHSHTHTHA